LEREGEHFVATFGDGHVVRLSVEDLRRVTQNTKQDFFAVGSQTRGDTPLPAPVAWTGAEFKAPEMFAHEALITSNNCFLTNLSI
jgi:hypothetical protein